MAGLPQIPPPPPPNVQRFNPATGTPTEAQVTYETKMNALLKAIKDKLDTL